MYKTNLEIGNVYRFENSNLFLITRNENFLTLKNIKRAYKLKVYVTRIKIV